MRACIILPVYNHPHYLADLIEYVQQYQLPVILVDDGSHAECKQVIDQLIKRYEISLLRHTVNQGKGQAVMTGLLYAEQQGYSNALQLDADGQHHWPDIEKFLSIATQHPNAMIIGKPMFDDSVPKKRLYGRYATHIWVWINALSFEIQDSMCGFRVYPVASAAKIIRENKLEPRMGYDSEILVRLSWEAVEFINVDTPVIYPEDGISHFNLWRDNVGLSKMHAKLLFGMLTRLPRLLKRNMTKPTQVNSSHD